MSFSYVTVPVKYQMRNKYQKYQMRNKFPIENFLKIPFMTQNPFTHRLDSFEEQVESFEDQMRGKFPLEDFSSFGEIFGDFVAVHVIRLAPRFDHAQRRLHFVDVLLHFACGERREMVGDGGLGDIVAVISFDSSDFKMRSRISIRGHVRRSVGPSIHRSVRPSVTHELNFWKLRYFD